MSKPLQKDAPLPKVLRNLFRFTHDQWTRETHPMTVSNTYIDRVIACLSRVAEVSYRRIFNGVGIYYRGVQFAIVINDHLYFRADEYSRPLYMQKAMKAFQPRASVPVESWFFELPDDVLGAPGELRHWLRIAVEAAQSGDYRDDETTLDTPIRHLRQRA